VRKRKRFRRRRPGWIWMRQIAKIGSVSRYRFFVPGADAAGATIALPDDEAHHLRQVLRLRMGDAVSVFDGRGHEWAGCVAQVGKRGVTIERGEAVAPAPEAPVHLTLAVGILKGDQMDVVIRDACALGAAAIVPLASEHVTVPARAWTSASATERWTRVAVASAKQCGRAVVPAIGPVATFESALAMHVEMRVCGVEPIHAASQPLAFAATGRPATALALVGPEGGWSVGEVKHARDRGARLISLGPRTLRAEIASTVLLAALWTAWGWS
jgi:16S rRNA (uracil1498-N3)-methyltransferase